MFGIGWAEMMVIGLVALIVVGPEKLPEMARTIGKIYSQLRQAATEAGQTISAEVELINSEASKVLEEVDQDLPKTLIDHPSLEEIKEAVNPKSLFSEDKAPEPPETAAAPEKQPDGQDSPSLPSPDPAEVAKDA